MIVVANAGPLIALAQLGQIELIGIIFGKIHIPPAVQNEVVKLGDNRPGAKAVSKAPWITVVTVQSRIVVQLLQERLDLGESEAVALALELRADLLLMDEARGRRVAEMQGIKKIGTIGTLLVAKDKGLISSVTPLLDKLRVCGFRMDQKLYDAACQLAGEEK